MAGQTAIVSPADRTLGDLVRADARAALVFEHFGLDFCCGGRRSLGEAARAHSVALAEVIDALDALGSAAPIERDPAEWGDLDVLVRHVVDHHHAYVRQTSPMIGAWLDRLVQRHGARRPELVEVRDIFIAMSEEMSAHMMKEEHILFPAISELAAAKRNGGRRPASAFGTVANPIRMMEDDHEQAGDRLGRLKALTANFMPPDDACTTFRSCYAELARYEEDLHRHVHLENNVLFPRAVELEQMLG